MSDNLHDLLSDINNLLILLIIIFLLYRREFLGKSIALFTAAMITTLSTEVTAKIAAYNEVANTTPIYVLGINLVTFLLFFIYFRQLVVLARNRNLITFIIILHLLSYAAFALFLDQFFFVFPLYHYFFAIILLISVIAIFLVETFNSNLIFYIKNYYPFYVSLGLIVIYIGLLPILIFLNNVNIGIKKIIYSLVLFFINFIGYGTILWGIFASKKLDEH